jgi:16S rRNA C967 or C1407 C5-methylase (RsmB/RsmF family)
VIDWALRTQPVTTLPLLPSHAVISPAFEAPFGKKLNEGVARCGRIHPHTNDSNGMFIARLALTDR